jgi:alkylation response protein AidB-like acyl-CoA dehydrogenase
MDFRLSDENTMLKDSVRKFADRELTPVAAALDAESRFPWDVLKKAGDAGFIGSYLPEEYGGGGSDLFSKAIIYEEFVRACFGFNLSVNASDLLFANNVNKLGTEEQKQKYLPPVIRGEKLGCWALTEPGAGSDAMSIKTTWVKDGGRYVVNGAKTLITNAPEASYFIVIARAPGTTKRAGGTAFILERGMEGLTTGKPFDKLGCRCSPTGEIFLDNVRVPPEQTLGGEGAAFDDMLKSLDVERSLTPFSSIGITQACLDASVEYAKTRVQFGRPIGSFQLIQEMIAEMAAALEIARTFAYRVVWMAQNGIKCTKEAAMIKMFASRMVNKAANDALQIHGGYGYMKEYNVERYLRDARLLEIGAGTTEIQKLVIAREVMGKL